MGLKEQLDLDLKAAMKSGDEDRKGAVRSIRAAIKETEQKNREELAKKALKKHGVERPTSTEEADIAAYNKAVDAALAAEQVELQSLMDDGAILGLIQKLIKMRQDTIADAQRAGRADMVKAEQVQMAILESYLPRQMSREEIAAEARKVIAEVGASSARDMGKVMGPLTAILKGRADGKLISEVVRELLA
jgi:hypothetical protein